MAVKSNASDKQTVREFTLKIGPVLCGVELVNPTLAQLSAIGYNFQNEPEYNTLDDKEGHEKVRLDFYLVNSTLGFRQKVTFFLENKERSNKDGDKFEFINNQAQSTWGTSVEEVVAKVGKNGNTWFAPEGAKKALIGEVSLYNFIKTWANVEPKEECVLDNIKAVFKGNFKELQGLVKMLADNTLWVMAEVSTKDNKSYQSVNNQYFGRATSKLFANNFAKFAADQKASGYPLKNIWGTEFKDYIAKPVVADAESQPAGTDIKNVDF